MVTLPAATPVTTPLTETVAIAELLVVQVPPVVVEDKVVVDPGQTAAVPDIVPAVGRLFTVTTARATAVPHTPVTVYLMVSMPAATPVTTPPVLTVAELVFVLLQVPPVTVCDKLIVAPGQTDAAPLMAPAFVAGLTVMV